MLMMALPSPADDSVAVATWVRCDVDVESSLGQCCRVMLAMVLSRRLGRDVM
jgi:hypothetical protein